MHVLVIHVGPVQEFIASARKCRDLWFGSWLVSELARAAAKAVVAAEDRAEADVLVFPGASTGNPDRSVANKVVARIAVPPVDVATKAEEAVMQRLRTIRDRAFAKVGRDTPLEQRRALFHEDVAKQQVDDAIELLWAAALEGACGYKAALDEAERLLAAVKNTRCWKQPAWAKDGVPKSSLDGMRESVLDEALYPKPRRRVDTPPPDAGRLRYAFGVHQAERLCGVGLLKRFGDHDGHSDKTTPQRIFSTLHLASGSFRAGLAAIQAKTEWSRYRDELERIHRDLVPRLEVVPRRDEITEYVDGTVFYQERLVEALEELGEDGTGKIDDARAALRRFLKAVRPRLGDPIPYYAILLGDGDRMGKVIDSLSDASRHRALSETLERFASSTRELVEQKHSGALIYAGGDDILALLPLHQALGCAAKLAAGFAEAMRSWTISEDGRACSPTLSMGIAVVHQMLPLDEALAMVRATEKAAKGVAGKNALAIVIKKRGGEAVQVEGHWGVIDERLRTLVTLHRQNAISSKAQYELMDLAHRLEDAGALAETLTKVREAEAKRLLARKREGGGRALLGRSTIEMLENLGTFHDPARLGRELYVAALFAQAEQQADPLPVADAQATAAEVTS